MREYRYAATDETIAALRHLQRPWRGWLVSESELVVRCGTGVTVAVAADVADVEPKFEAVRLAADLVSDRTVPQVEDAFARGLNDVVLFNSETWIEAHEGPAPGLLGRNAVVQYDGLPGTTPDSAVATCLVTDALLLDSRAGARLLVRCAWPPGRLEVVEAPEAIDAFLRERGYEAEEA